MCNFVMFVISAFHPSFVHKSTIPGSLCSASLLSVNLDGKNSGHVLQNSLFLRDYWTKSDGVFAEMQMNSNSFIIIKHIKINQQFRNLLMLKFQL